MHGQALHGVDRLVVHARGNQSAMLPLPVVNDVLQVALGAAVKRDLQAHGLRRLRFSMSIGFSPRLASASAGSTIARSSSDST